MNDAARPLVDKEAFDQFAELMEGELPEVLAQHFKVTQGYLESLRRCAEKGDAAAMVEAAHPLKSSSRQIGAMRVGDLAEAIEHVSKETSPDVVRLMHLIDSAQAAQEATCQALAPYLKGMVA